MSKLWRKLHTLDALIEEYTVGEDALLDKKLVSADCVASIAHAQMLASIGILEDREFEALKGELVQIIRLSQRGEFSITVSDEDCHTAIENHLTARLGASGKKIHAGRSRNDQVIAALRLYSRAFLLEYKMACLELISGMLDFAGKHAGLPMPGRTHMQIAMPSSVGLWAAAFAEELIDDLELVDLAYRLNNTSPLGSAASYGVPLPLDRQMVSDALAFDKVQNNVLYVNNSRGKFESIILSGVEHVSLSLSKMAQDILLFSMPEFKYFTLPESLCPGSSIMPQKKNPGMLELIRAKAATISALNGQIKAVIRGLPSGYNRDFQETKPAFMHALRIGLSSVRVFALVLEKLEVNEEGLLKGFIPEIFATDRVLELVQEGKPFRDAYREVGLNLGALKDMDPFEALKKKTYQGTTGNLGLELSREAVRRHTAALQAEQDRVREKIAAVTGFETALFP